MTAIQKREIMSLFIHVLKKVWVQNNIMSLTSMTFTIWTKASFSKYLLLCSTESYTACFWVNNPFNIFALKKYVYMYRHLLYTGPF